MTLRLHQHGTEPSDLRHQGHLLQMVSAFWQSQALNALVVTGLADALTTEPLDVAQLAERAGVDQRAAGRLLRYLAGVGVVTCPAPDSYAASPIVELVRDGRPFRDLVLMFGDDFYRAWGSFAATIRDGRSSYHHEYGAELFEFLASHPDKAKRFDTAMAALAAPIAAALASAVDFSDVGLVVDVGGGNGALLDAILRTDPDVRGLNLEVDHVAAAARARVEASGLSGRLGVVAGDFFHAVPAGGDVYVLSRVLHDWQDSDCLRILRSCRIAMTKGAELLVVERLLPEAPAATMASLYDLQMMAVTGGRERTRREFEELLDGVGFVLDSVLSLPFETSLMTAHAV
jgi:SAM-dependent methyltransferase